MLGEKNLGKCTVYICIEVILKLFVLLFIFTSFNTTPLILLVKIILV